MALEDSFSAYAERLARRFHERQLEDALEQIGLLIHEDAEMTLVVNGLKPLCGREVIVTSLSGVRESMIYSAEVKSCEWLDEDTLLLRGNARYSVGDRGLSHSTIWWLDKFREGLLFQVRAFQTEPEARTAHQAPPPAG